MAFAFIFGNPAGRIRPSILLVGAFARAFGESYFANSLDEATWVFLSLVLCDRTVEIKTWNGSGVHEACPRSPPPGKAPSGHTLLINSMTRLAVFMRAPPGHRFSDG